jgi:hypothetical protein
MVTEVAVTPGAADPPVDPAVVAVVAVEPVVVVVEALVPDEHPAASSPTPIAKAIGANQFPRCIPINTLPCV